MSMSQKPAELRKPSFRKCQIQISVDTKLHNAIGNVVSPSFCLHGRIKSSNVNVTEPGRIADTISNEVPNPDFLWRNRIGNVLSANLSKSAFNKELTASNVIVTNPTEL